VNLYNEIDPYAAQWLRNLIDAGEIPPGDVNETPIEELNADDLVRYAQCHFFAGIGGWSLALRLAGWPDDEPVWTGSCPCQPFSVAGKGLGEDDPRHLWPAFRKLIAKCRPNVIFGEQVAGAAGLRWLSGVQADVEEDSYRLGFAELCAAGVGAPHIRQRLFWVADCPERGCGEQWGADQPGRSGYADGGGAAGGLADTQDANRRAGERGTEEGTWPNGERRRGLAGGGTVGGLDHPQRPRLEERDGQRKQQLRQDAELVAAGHCAWSDFDILNCLDGKARRTQSGLFPLAHGVSGRVAVRRAGQEHWYSRTGTLRGFGNAIVPQVGAEFIRAYMEVA
jgi:DNA (cytosine-5)-methyltransferase 1